MAQILQLAHLVEHHGVADMDVRRRRVQAELDAQRHAGGLGARQFAQPVVLRNQFLAAAQRDGQRRAHRVGHRKIGLGGYSHVAFWLALSRCVDIISAFPGA